MPIQRAQCWFPGLATSSAKKLIYFSTKIYGSNFIKQHSETVMVWNHQNADCSLRKKFIESFIIISGTFSFPADSRHFTTSNILEVFLRDPVCQVADVQCRHQLVLGNVQLRHAVIAPHQLLRDWVIDAKEAVLNVLIGQWVIRICRLLVSICDRYISTSKVPRTRISSGTLRSIIEYGLPLPLTTQLGCEHDMYCCHKLWDRKM